MVCQKSVSQLFCHLAPPLSSSQASVCVCLTVCILLFFSSSMSRPQKQKTLHTAHCSCLLPTQAREGGRERARLSPPSPPALRRGAATLSPPLPCPLVCVLSRGSKKSAAAGNPQPHDTHEPACVCAIAASCGKSKARRVGRKTSQHAAPPKKPWRRPAC